MSSGHVVRQFTVYKDRFYTDALTPQKNTRYCTNDDIWLLDDSSSLQVVHTSLPKMPERFWQVAALLQHDRYPIKYVEFFHNYPSPRCDDARLDGIVLFDEKGTFRLHVAPASFCKSGEADTDAYHRDIIWAVLSWLGLDEEQIRLIELHANYGKSGVYALGVQFSKPKVGWRRNVADTDGRGDMMNPRSRRAAA